MGVKTGAKTLVRNEVNEEDVFAITDETQLTGRRERSARRKKIEEKR